MATVICWLRVDLIVDEGDALVLTDLKTSKSKWSFHQIDQSGEQLLLYSHLVKRLDPQKDLRLEYQVLSKTKQPILECHKVDFTPERTSRNLAISRRILDEMECGLVYPSPSVFSCAGCPYKDPCRRWQGRKHEGG